MGELPALPHTPLLGGRGAPLPHPPRDFLHIFNFHNGRTGSFIDAIRLCLNARAFYFTVQKALRLYSQFLYPIETGLCPSKRVYFDSSCSFSIDIKPPPPPPPPPLRKDYTNGPMIGMQEAMRVLVKCMTAERYWNLLLNCIMSL